MTLKLTDFQNLGQSSIQVSPIAYGMWRFAGTDVKTATEKIETALDVGITFFDQADIYGCDGGGSFGRGCAFSVEPLPLPPGRVPDGKNHSPKTLDLYVS